MLKSGLLNDYTKKVKATRYSACQKFLHITKKLAWGLESRREFCWGYVSISESTPEELILKSIFQLKVAATLVSGSRKGAVGA